MSVRRAASGVAAFLSLVAIALLIPAVGSATPQSLCIGHHPQDFVWYTHSCTGHDEPELDPLSNAPGSAQDLTWTVVLPTDGRPPVNRTQRSSGTHRSARGTCPAAQILPATKHRDGYRRTADETAQGVGA